MEIKGAIFDMDGTLVDSLMFWDVLWSDIGREYLGDGDFRPTEEADKTVRTMIFTDAMAYIRRLYRIEEDDDAFFAFAERKLETFYRSEVRMKAGARELLGYLRRAGVRMCLASASDRKYIEIAIDAFGLSDYFDAVLSCVDIGKGKSEPDIYRMALEALRCAPSEAAVFEDSFVALETAKGIGCRTVGIFDRYNFGQDRLSAASDIYVGEGESLEGLIGRVKCGT